MEDLPGEASYLIQRLECAGVDAPTLAKLAALPSVALDPEQRLRLVELDPEHTGRLLIAHTLREAGREEQAIDGLLAIPRERLSDEGRVLAAEMMLEIGRTKGVQKLLPALSLSIEDYHRRVPTRKVNEVLRAAQQAQPGPHGVKVLYGTQAAPDPPTFTLFANREIPATYLRYLERRLREDFDLGATPIKMRVRKR